MQQSYLTIWDLVLTPLYLIILVFIAKRIRDKLYPVGHPLRRYYLPGLLVKFGGAIFVGLLIQFYYGGGDTFNFFYHSRTINSSLDDSFLMWLKLVFRFSPETDPYIYRYSSQLYWYNDVSSYTTATIGAVFGLLNGTTYMPIALLFAYFSFTGIWAMYKTFISIYPSLHKPLALAFLFVPSTVVWGSGFSKDSVCMFGLGWLTYSVFRTFVNRDFSLKNWLLLGGSFFLIALIKMYILVAFVPALLIWILMIYSSRFKTKTIRWITTFVLAGFAAGVLFFFSQSFEDKLGRYSLDQLAKTAKETQNYITYVSEVEGGSGYDLGDFEPTLTGMLRKSPEAVIVTLFRPFVWEIKKPIMLVSAAEALAFLCIVFYVIYKIGILKSLRVTFKDPNLIFFLIYTLIFAFAVGISTGNFGTLSRYKIPCMPFFAALLVVLYYKYGPQVQRNVVSEKKRVVSLPA